MLKDWLPRYEEAMSLSALLKDAVKDAVSATLAEEVRKETRRALREHEEALTTMVRAAVVAAIGELLNGKDA